MTSITSQIRSIIGFLISFCPNPFLPPLSSQRKENPWMIDVDRLPLEGQGGLVDLLKTLVDPRKSRGVRHPVVTIVAIAACAALSRARRSWLRCEIWRSLYCAWPAPAVSPRRCAPVHALANASYGPSACPFNFDGAVLIFSCLSNGRFSFREFSTFSPFRSRASVSSLFLVRRVSTLTGRAASDGLNSIFV
jgi:hypothetical protein